MLLFRLGFTLFVPAALALWFYMMPSVYGRLPILLSFASGFLYIIWFGTYAAPKGPYERVMYQDVAAAVGVMLIVLVLTMMIQSILAHAEASGWRLTASALTDNKWLAENVASGRLAFYASALMFGGTLLSNGRKHQISRLALPQYLIFAGGFLILSFGYAVDRQITYLGLLSWSIFFIIGDWKAVDHYVIKKGAKLEYWTYRKLVAVNAVILFAMIVVKQQVFALEWDFLNWFAGVLSSIAMILIWGYLYFILRALARRPEQPDARVPPELEKLLP